MRAEWEYRPSWNLNGQLNWIADRSRAASDTRQPIDDYTTVDVTLRHKSDNSPWEFALLGHNIFNENAREPSPAPGLITNDLPLAGSSYYLEGSYHLK
jgi:iron complex outermembrane receptor protein